MTRQWREARHRASHGSRLLEEAYFTIRLIFSYSAF